jgi:multidrug efflux pump subunit AcrB
MRELARTRLLAERALFVAQWMPTLLRWQTELLAQNSMAMPEVQQLITNTTRLVSSVERFAAVAEQLPGQVRSERQEILKALEAQENKLTPLVNEVRLTLASGSQFSTSLNTTITTFDGLMKRFGVGETNVVDAPDTNREPFRITDYGQTAEKLEAAARQLTELFRTFDHALGSTNLTRLSTEITPVVQQAQTSGRDVVDYAFGRVALLILIGLAAALVYRFISPRLGPGRRPPPHSP